MWSNCEYVILVNAGDNFTIPYRSSAELVIIAAFVHQYITFAQQIATDFVWINFYLSYIFNIDVAILNISDS